MPHVAVFDSGLGGLTVLEAIRRTLPGVAITYVADNAAFPYGPKPEAEVRARVVSVIGALLAVETPDAVVIACNTASTAALGALRETFPGMPFVGTVPALKPAAEVTRTGVIGLLATPGTVHRPYIDDLAARVAAGCRIVRVGAPRLATLAEGMLRGIAPPPGAVAAEIAPLFNDPLLDVVVLGCTHYPLLRQALQEAAPRPVHWLDSADAVARQTVRLCGTAAGAVVQTSNRCLLTKGAADMAAPLVLVGLDRPVLLAV
ncbi:MAG: glutamate racemase [Rhodospirillaceae bacterium]